MTEKEETRRKKQAEQERAVLNIRLISTGHRESCASGLHFESLLSVRVIHLAKSGRG